MELSLYTLLFEKDNKYYLYNSETEFLSLVSEEIYEKLHDGAYDDIKKEDIDVLKARKILVESENLFERKKYNICCFLNEQQILEDCLLTSVENPTEAIHKISAI